ncbi:MAG: hypothetical protein EOP06_29755 [Proteobacteria bacterium]|nr:MAG: hypothetical protein EOP06_29755 [Pseudomonadota bacterium]
MNFKRLCSGSLALVLSFAMVEVTFSLNAHAGMITTSEAVSNVARARNLQTVQTFLSRGDVQSELVKRGVAPAEAVERVAGLSDFELQKVAGNIENAPAGADAIVISLTTVLLVIIILLLLGKI